MKLRQVYSRHFYWIVLALLTFACMLHAASWSNGHNWGGDFAAYIEQANSIMNGKTAEYVATNRITIDESGSYLGPPSYPWGYPLLLATGGFFLGSSLLSFKVINLIFFVIFLLTCHLPFSDLSRKERLLLIALLALNPYFLRFGDNILSDIPYLTVSTLTVSLIVRVSTLINKSSPSWLGFSVLTGILMSASVEVRSAGLILISAYCAFMFSEILLLVKEKKLLWQRKAAALSLFLVASLSASFAFSYMSHRLVENSVSAYKSHVAIGLHAMFQGLQYYLHTPIEFFGGSWIGFLLYICSLPISAFGLMAKWRTNRMFTLYALLTLLACIAWPLGQGFRLLIPLTPLYIYFLIKGFGCIGTTFPNSNAHVTRLFFMGLMLVGFTTQSLGSCIKMLQRGKIIDGPYDLASREMFNFVKKHIPCNEIVIFDKPRVMRLLTSRNSISGEKLASFSERKWYIQRNGHETRASKLYMNRSLADNGEFPTLRFSNQRFEIFQLR